MGLRAAFAAVLLACPALAREGPLLDVASNFEHGDFPEKMAASAMLPVLDFPDVMRWHEVEQADGSYLFDNPCSTFPRRLANWARA